MSGAPSPELDPDIGDDARTAPSHALLLCAIAAGGAVGTLGRWSLGKAIPTDGYGFSWATFIANLTGAFALGLLIAVVARRLPHTHYVRPALGTGVLGGFTTFSTFMVETAQRLDHGHVVLAFSYVALSLIGGLVLSAAGLVLGSRVPAS